VEGEKIPPKQWLKREEKRFGRALQKGSKCRSPLFGQRGLLYPPKCPPISKAENSLKKPNPKLIWKPKNP